MVTRTKLAVFLHADVVGSTSLVQLNESLAHDRITDAFKKLTRIVELYGGTVKEVRGDALIADRPWPILSGDLFTAKERSLMKHWSKQKYRLELSQVMQMDTY